MIITTLPLGAAHNVVSILIKCIFTHSSKYLDLLYKPWYVSSTCKNKLPITTLVNRNSAETKKRNCVPTSTATTLVTKMNKKCRCGCVRNLDGDVSWRKQTYRLSVHTTPLFLLRLEIQLLSTLKSLVWSNEHILLWWALVAKKRKREMRREERKWVRRTPKKRKKNKMRREEDSESE